ncbi:MAG: creatininase family protein [Kiritimatiellia bacterium]|nr:creatininase family protein [Kiritimatiellia bacterium]
MSPTRNSQKTPFPVMEDMTVKMVRDYLKRKKSIIIPVGVIEQHGYHLPLKTDALQAEHFSRMIGEKTGILVAPTMYQSFSGGECPGTINISPATMSLVISDMLVSLVSQGFRNFYLFLNHGGSENDRALDNALKLLLRTNPAFKQAMICLMPVWKFGGTTGWKKAFREGDWHAGWLETSIVMAFEPHLVRMDELKKDPQKLVKLMTQHPDNYQHAQKIVDDEFVVAKTGQRPDVQVGVMGFPERASRALGKKIIADIVASASKKIMEIEKKADGIYREVAFKPEPLMLET